MVVAVLAVRVVQVTVDQVIEVVAVRHGLVPAVGPVDVGGLVPLASVARRAVSGIGSVHLEAVLVRVIAVGVMEVAPVEVVDVISVLDGNVPAVGTVDVVVVGMLFAAHFQVSSSPACSSTPWTSSAT